MVITGALFCHVRCVYWLANPSVLRCQFFALATCQPPLKQDFVTLVNYVPDETLAS